MQEAPIYGRRTRGRAPEKGVMDSDIPTYLSGKTQAEGQRERAPARGVKVSDAAPCFLGLHPVDGIREGAPGQEVKDSDNPTQPSDSVGKRERASAKGVKG